MSDDSFKDIWGLRNRGARDSERHKQRVREAIKKNLHELIAEENIISSNGGKKIKIPMKFLDMYRFKFGKNSKSKGIGHGEGKSGDIIGKESGKSDDMSGGNKTGEEIYEEEVNIDEVIDMMLDDLNLPWLEEKEKTVEIETENIIFQDIAEKGLPSNIDKRKTVIENIKRNALKGKMKIGGFENSDLRYRVWEKIVEIHSNASVFLLMDRSGSMSSEKKYIVKSFFWWMVRFLERKYKHVELIFIAHDTEAREVEEEKFFSISDSGGTMVSSAFILAKKIIDERFSPSIWNNYVFSFSDGDNWLKDNDKCIKSVKDILPVCQAVGYGEVLYTQYFYDFFRKSQSDTKPSGLLGLFENDKELSSNSRFICSSIDKREQIYECLSKFLKGVKNEKKL